MNEGNKGQAAKWEWECKVVVKMEGVGKLGWIWSCYVKLGMCVKRSEEETMRKVCMCMYESEVEE